MRALLGFIFCAAMAVAQTSTFSSGYSSIVSFSPVHKNAAVTGAPYSADEINETVQTLANGTHITHQYGASKVYRDSAGRTRTERARLTGIASLDSQQIVIVEINDPVAQVKYTLDPVNKVAHKQQWSVASTAAALPAGVIGGVTSGSGSSAASVSGQPTAASSMPPARPRPEVTHENLGTNVIEGVAVRGTRQTTIWPANSVGNDQPISSVIDLWTSPELKVLIFSKMDDPRMGERTHKLTNISRTEPSPDLFLPPADYAIVEEEGAFTLKWENAQ